MEWINVAKESLEFAFASISVGALVYGAWIGGKAVKKYQMQNEIDAKYSLIAADNEIFAVVRSKPFLESFFMVCDDNILPKDKADRLLSALLHGTSGSYKRWENVQDIVDWPWEENDFFSEGKDRFRYGTYLAERIIILLTLAHGAWQDRLISKEDYHGYTNYIDTIGHHPLFLAAIHYWARHRFIRQSFAAELRNRLLMSQEAKEMIHVIYPQIESDKWLDMIR
ncbi:hypothetical protein Deba_0778 [Desulfarculus baarsii DSM 2075]|uniref:Uncharacterized protein n=1 Tax=Desulfarculus baarsii (strain ATCC 33931 / DSM 2075 / LMG 7858 / VKM B-1802 / 2st14) TaxID=644282 RepID=E1QF14_DESB2|nr:hypothetical protein [Desulfarculus baarsii]ADK84150.1 hypothetical protein Deba_0778 [Desulfarculus baarsii DSM 2075]